MDEQDCLTQIPASVRSGCIRQGISVFVDGKLGSDVEKTAVWAASGEEAFCVSTDVELQTVWSITGLMPQTETTHIL